MKQRTAPFIITARRWGAHGALLPLLALLVFPPEAAAEDDPCRPLESIKPAFNPSQEGIKANCELGKECVSALATQVRESQRLTEQIRRSCTAMEKQGKNSTAVGGQEDAQGKALATTRAAQQETSGLIRALDEAFNRQRSALDGLAGKMTADQRRATSSQEAARASNAGRPLRWKGEAGGDADQFAILNGVEFLHQVALEISRKSAYFDALDKEAAKIAENKENLGPGKKKTDGPSVSDMVQAGSMASGLAGLAAANRQQPKPGSNLTEPTNGKLGATSPTPESPASRAPADFASTSLGTNGQAPAGHPAGSVAPSLPRAPFPFSPLAPPAEGSEPRYSSDATRAESSFPIAATGSSRGGENGLLNGRAPATTTEDTANGNPEGKTKDEDPALGGSSYFGGFGGMGGLTSQGQAPPGTPNEGDAEKAENLKDIYDGMKSAATDAEDPENGGALASGIQGTEGDDVFQRVHACLVRNLRKGLVQNGLGESLLEE